MDIQYYLFFIPQDREFFCAKSLSNYVFLGYDLIDETYTSSIFNCGKWSGRLIHFKSLMNQYGLFGLEDEKEIKSLLTLQWGDIEPHAKANIWGLYEVSKSN